MNPAIDIREVMTSPALFGKEFGGPSFAAWRALLCAFYGLKLSDEEKETLIALTGRALVPFGAFEELWLVIGRRGGKSQVAALIAIYEALFTDYRKQLAAGEVATVMVIAADRKQARSVMRYTSGLINSNPMLKRSLVKETTEELTFNNRAVIEVATASFRSTRGYTLSCAILDEIAFWHSDGANPDAEVVGGLRPAMATLGGKLIALSSPYSRRGVLWSTYKRHYAGESPHILVAQAPSRTMNPTLKQRVVDNAIAEDPEAARAEYLAQFRSDISAFLELEQIEQATRSKPLILPPSYRDTYFGFVDPAGGGKDEFTLSVAHREGDLTVVDGVWGRLGSPAVITEEFANILDSYGVPRVTGDRYAGRWVSDEFARHKITYEASERDRSQLYLDLMARLNSGSVVLPPCEKMQRQLANLERRTSRNGRDTIDHPPHSHDDRANAVAGAVAIAALPNRRMQFVQLTGI